MTLIVIDISFGREQRHLDLDLETPDSGHGDHTAHWALTGTGCGVCQNLILAAPYTIHNAFIAS